ncbi:MAG: mechanosensitive ion channel family protein [Bacteroidales bacterium]|nr:mechanosensitive ion channel family protein [Bacteroidales bacterium]
MLHSIIDFKSYFIDLGWDEVYVRHINALIWSGIIVVLAWLLDWISKRVLLRIIRKVINRSTSHWDDMLYEKKVFHRLSHFVSLIMIYALSPYVLSELSESFTHIARGAVNIAAILLFLALLHSLLEGIKEIYNSYEISKYRSINGYVQVVRIIFVSMGVIWIVSILLGKSPTVLFTGISAMAAILMLVFKDTLLGFVASIQISANDMVRPGDWITFSKYQADGTVTEINLTTVKVQNGDKTITTIPTYALVADSFINWRGMEEAQGRRIKRALNVDLNSISFCSPEQLERFKKVEILGSYIDDRLAEIESLKAGQEGLFHRSRNLTNIGLFRQYLENYLRVNPAINHDMNIVVRQLQPTENGIPIEIYAFSIHKSWVDFEKVQSDLFDHILAKAPEFDLNIFQHPTGQDFKRLQA